MKIVNRNFNIAQSLLRFFNKPTPWLSRIEEYAIRSRFRIHFWLSNCFIVGDSPVGIYEKGFLWCGTGMDTDKATARIKSIVEATERWASNTYGLRQSGKFGFNVMPCTT